jgi:hypothetical protein
MTKTQNVILFVLFCFLIICTYYCCKKTDIQTNLDKAVNMYAYEYNLDPILCWSIISCETYALRWDRRNDYYKLKKQGWADYTIQKYNLDKKNIGIWYSCGPWQILFLTAVELGYKGTPIELTTNYYTNCKYGCKYLSYKIIQYKTSDETFSDAIASYNAGRVRKYNGLYYNQEYVNKVKNKYMEIVNYMTMSNDLQSYETSMEKIIRRIK